jgi:hypothetical protein
MRKLAFLILLALPLFAETNIKLTADDKAKVVKLTHALESAPLAADARESRAWLVSMLTQTDDPNVVVCAGLFTDLLSDKSYKYQSALIAQPIFGQGAYLIENPDANNRDTETFVAGIRSLLQAYEGFVAKDAKAKRPYLDALVAARDKNELTAWVDKHLETCRK